jgi:hypothetical protein
MGKQFHVFSSKKDYSGRIVFAFGYLLSAVLGGLVIWDGYHGWNSFIVYALVTLTVFSLLGGAFAWASWSVLRFSALLLGFQDAHVFTLLPSKLARILSIKNSRHAIRAWDVFARKLPTFEIQTYRPYPGRGPTRYYEVKKNEKDKTRR